MPTTDILRMRHSVSVFFIADLEPLLNFWLGNVDRLAGLFLQSHQHYFCSNQVNSQAAVIPYIEADIKPEMAVFVGTFSNNGNLNKRPMPNITNQAIKLNIHPFSNTLSCPTTER